MKCYRVKLEVVLDIHIEDRAVVDVPSIVHEAAYHFGSTCPGCIVADTEIREILSSEEVKSED